MFFGCDLELCRGTNVPDLLHAIPIRQKELSTFDTRTRTGMERTDEVSMGNHDTVKELGSLVQQAQLRAGVKSNRGSGNCAESRTHSFTSAVEKFLRDKPSTNCTQRAPFQTTASNPGQDFAPRRSPRQRSRSCSSSNQRQGRPKHHRCR